VNYQVAVALAESVFRWDLIEVTCSDTVFDTRDDFTLTVRRTLAQRVNYRCSNPTCGANTSGPQIDPEKSMSIGVAAHITAASPRGPRYDASLSEDQRKSPENGIWLCQNCAKLVDNDQMRFTGALLCHWKRTAEQYATQQIGRRSPFDRTDTPRLEFVVQVSDRTALTSVEWNKGELLEDLLTLLPAGIRTEERATLLANGVGAFGQSYAILGLGSQHDQEWTIILFTAGEFGWEIVARTNLENQKGREPAVLYVPGTPGAVAITHVNGWGTGLFRRSTSWYRIAKGAPAPILSYPHSFHVAGWGMPFDRRLTSRILGVPNMLRPGLSLDLEFEIEYNISSQFVQPGSDSVLFSLSEMLSLEWSNTANTFVPRTAKDDFARLEELWLEGTAEFMCRNGAILQKLARTGTECQRRFVKEHFSEILARPGSM
jgi:hypothetical protein